MADMTVSCTQKKLCVITPSFILLFHIVAKQLDFVNILFCNQSYAPTLLCILAVGILMQETPERKIRSGVIFIFFPWVFHSSGE